MNFAIRYFATFTVEVQLQLARCINHSETTMFVAHASLTNHQPSPESSVSQQPVQRKVMLICMLQSWSDMS